MPSQRFSMLARVGFEMAWSEAARACRAFSEANGPARTAAGLRGAARAMERRNIVRQVGGGITTSKASQLMVERGVRDQKSLAARGARLEKRVEGEGRGVMVEGLKLFWVV